MEDARGNKTLPKAPFTLNRAQKQVLCNWVKDLKFPDGYASDLARCVALLSCKLHGMKSHDCHVFMERLLPVTFKELLPVHVWKAITEISLFFRDLCCSTITLSDIERLEHNIAEILCKLEKIFPPSFFHSMERLPVHLPYEARLCGPVHYRWMYPFERFLNHLKRKIGNKARVERSICMAYLAEEISNFCSNYFQDGVDTKTRGLSRKVNLNVENTLDQNVPECFRVDCGRSSTGGVLRFMDEVKLIRAHLYVLTNTGILEDYKRGFEEYIVQTRPIIRKEDVWVRHEVEFLEWFRKKRVRTWNQYYVNGYNFQTHEHGKHKSTQYYVNGYNFQTHEHGKHKFTQNYGVVCQIRKVETTLVSCRMSLNSSSLMPAEFIKLFCSSAVGWTVRGA
ncbi:uncharacterized protein LOC110704799 isoform X2 [Chenopodium quinoa]|uniref:uncharacterized protein LOC110704799 isoform X2 n=1 Tax=Chenopodium quinoa TaxID=63459 RepID=UPI000B77B317|nr:uncharacterized protein LOC110704799 isoform X2 [Chenopodium quinoa]